MHQVQRRRIEVGGLTLHVYGLDKAVAYSDRQEQGYFVEKAGQPTARAELTQAERAAVQACLAERFPEHATL